jgi:eukaryotic-like serine/threonine-protein kinase
MTAEWTRIRQVFEAALDLEPGDRRTFLSSECGEDDELRRKVEELLVADSADSVVDVAIEKPLPADFVEADLIEAIAGQRIGAYEIERVLGSGGMSTVFLAVQQSPRREVALKTMRGGMFSPETRRRFEFEAEILGRLRHPAIAQVFEAGTWKEPLAGQEVPFFALEYVRDAVPLDRYVRDHHLDLDRALELFTEVCDAVHYGHQLGVIHRDLKPANVLVDGEGRPKVIDFGIARATESDVQGLSMRTQTGHVLGTLCYMAPEQLDGLREEIDTRVDVYALGVILYEILAGAPLLDPATLSLTAFARRVREMEPPRPSRSRHGFDLSGYARDLDWITRKAIATEKDERYHAVSELAADIRRFLTNEPVSVGPPSTTYYVRKFVRRNKVLVGGVGAVFAVLVIGIITTWWQMRRAEESAATARREALKAGAINTFFNDLLKFADPAEGRYRSRPDWTVREALDAAAELFAGLRNEPDVEAQVRVSIGNAYKSLGQLDKADEYLQRAVDLRREHLGPNHVDLADAMLSLGAAKTAKRRYRDALELYRSAAEIFRTNFGELHSKVGLCTLNIGTSMARLGESENGARSIRKAVEIFNKLDPIPYRFIALCLPHLGNLAYSRKEPDSAITLYREALAMFEKADKAWHPHAAMVHTSLAFVLKTVKSDTAGAESHYVSAIEITENAWGRQAKQTRDALVNLASLLGKQARYAEELKHRRRILEIEKARVGEEANGFAVACYKLALAVQNSGGEAGEAEALLRKAVKIGSRVGGDRWNPVAFRARLAATLRRQGKIDEALPIARKGYGDGVAIAGEAAPKLRLISMEYAKCLRESAQFEAAERILRRRIAAEIAAKQPLHVMLNRNDLAIVLTRAKKFDEARELFGVIAKSPPPGIPDGHWVFGQFYRAYGVFLGAAGEHEKGVAQLERAITIFRKTLGENHPNVRLSLTNLADLYDAWEKPEEAKNARARIRD